MRGPDGQGSAVPDSPESPSGPAAPGCLGPPGTSVFHCGVACHPLRASRASPGKFHPFGTPFHLYIPADPHTGLSHCLAFWLPCLTLTTVSACRISYRSKSTVWGPVWLSLGAPVWAYTIISGDPVRVLILGCHRFRHLFGGLSGSLSVAQSGHTPPTRATRPGSPSLNSTPPCLPPSPPPPTKHEEIVPFASVCGACTYLSPTLSSRNPAVHVLCSLHLVFGSL